MFPSSVVKASAIASPKKSSPGSWLRFPNGKTARVGAAVLSGVNYFFRSATIIFPYQRQLLLRRRGAPPPRWRARARRAAGFGFERQETGDHSREVGWESGKPAFGFPLFQAASPELWECGNLAAFWRDFQGARGKSGKPAFGFPRFPQPRHFHSSSRPFFSRRRFCFHCCSVAPSACCFFLASSSR